MVTDGSYACGEHRITCRVVESLRCTPKTNETLCVHHTSIKKKKAIDVKQQQNSAIPMLLINPLFAFFPKKA